MKYFLTTILSLLLLSSPLFGQSTSKYESVSQCVLQTMAEKKLTGNKMFELVKEECERILGKVDNQPVVEKSSSGYVGEKKNGVPNGQGTFTFPDGTKYVGEWKDGLPNGQGTETFPDGGMY